MEGIDVIQEWNTNPKPDSGAAAAAAASSSAGSSPKAKSSLLPTQSTMQQQKQQQQPSFPTYMGMDQLVNKPGLEPPALGNVP